MRSILSLNLTFRAKNTLLFLLLWCSLASVWGQKFEYWAETTPIDQFIVIEKGEERIIASDRAENDQFIFKTDSPDVFIRIHCAKCKEEVSVTILGKKENAYTKQIYLKMEEGQSKTIQLAECFQQSKEKSLSERFGSLVSALKDFLQSARIGKIGKGGPFMRGENDSNGSEPQYLRFLEADYAHYFSPEDFSLHFEQSEDREIKNIYIVDARGGLVFLAGDNPLISELFDLSERKKCAVSDVLSAAKKEGGDVFQLNWTSIRPYVDPPLKMSQAYQLGIELTSEDPEPPTYLFNFTISESLAKQIEKFTNE